MTVQVADNYMSIALGRDPVDPLEAATKRYSDLKLALAGGTMTGVIAMGANKVTGLANGTVATDAAAFGQIPVASSTTPVMDGTAAVGSGTTWARSDHVHPSDTSRLAANLVANQIAYGGSGGSIGQSASFTVDAINNAIALLPGTAIALRLLEDAAPGTFAAISANAKLSGTTWSFDSTSASAFELQFAGTTGYVFRYAPASANPPVWSTLATLASTGLTMAVPIAMGTNKITGLGNGTAAQDAAAFGQLPVASTTTPLVEGTAAVGTSLTYARADHVHPAASATVSGLAAQQVLFGAAGGTIAQDAQFLWDTTNKVLRAGVSPTIQRWMHDGATAAAWTVNYNVITNTVDDTTHQALELDLDEINGFMFYHATAAATPVWSTLASLGPALNGTWALGSSPGTSRMMYGSPTFNLTLNAGLPGGTWTADDATKEVFAFQLSQGTGYLFYWAPPGNPPAWVQLATVRSLALAPAGPIPGFTLGGGPANILFQQEIKGLTNLDGLDILCNAQVVGPSSSIVWSFIQLNQPAMLHRFDLTSASWGWWWAPAAASGAPAWSNTMSLSSTGNLTIPGQMQSGTISMSSWFHGNPTTDGTWYFHGTEYFGSGNQTTVDVNGNWQFGGGGNIYLQAPNNAAYFRVNVTNFGTGDASHFDAAGSLVVGGNLTANNIFYGHTTCYFGTSNQSYFDTGGQLIMGANLLNHGVMYWGSSNQSYGNTDGTMYVAQWIQIGGNGELFLFSGDGCYHAHKWASGPYWQTFVNGTIVYSVTPNYCDEAVKRDIQPVTVDALQALRQVELVSYVLENKKVQPFAPRHFDIGFTAQRTRPYIPDAIIETEDGDGTPVLFLDHGPLIAYLVKAVQQMAERIEALEVVHGGH